MCHQSSDPRGSHSRTRILRGLRQVRPDRLTVPRRRSRASLLFRTARRVDDLEALASRNPMRIERRVKNKVVGQVLGRGGFWLWLWK